ncbi:MAG: Fe-S cluster assembly protein HesB [Frankiaceae bacterium]|nr:Fe-S cluster assembly protein HesB [Frankiaceae bacterium]
MAAKQVHLAQDADADALLSADPLALLVGMALDQQFPMERAFRGPHVMKQRMGAFDAATIAERADLRDVFAIPPVVHRFPGSMSQRVQELCRHIVDQYDGDAERLWNDVKTGDELLNRLQALPGFGKQKAQIFLALLGKQRGVRPKGWRGAAGAYGEDGSFRSIADVTSPESLLKVRAYKQEMKAAAKAGKD